MARGGKRAGAGTAKGRRSATTVALPLTLAEAARRHTADALQTLVEIMMDPEATPAARAACAKTILERGWGKTVQAATPPAAGDQAEGGSPAATDRNEAPPLAGTLEAIRRSRRGGAA
jgi:hypothetical protein